MRRLSFLMALAGVLALSASPVLAAKSGPNTGTRGLVSVTVSNSKTDSTVCSIKVSVKNIYPNTSIYLVSGILANSTAEFIGGTDGDGVFVADSPNVAARGDYNNSYALSIVTGSFYPVLSSDGVTPAGFNVANNCAPAS